MRTQDLLHFALSAYQSSTNPEQINHILSNTISLLTSLTNPLNISLLTSQLLNAPAIWSQIDGLTVSFRIISLFNTATITVRKNELEYNSNLSDGHITGKRSGVGCDEWTMAVLQGLNEKCSSWQHILVMTGILLGIEGQGGQEISKGVRNNLQLALVTATNLSLQQTTSIGIMAASSIVLALSHAFPLLPGTAQRRLNYVDLLPVMIRALTNMEGYQNGSFMEAVNSDLTLNDENKLDWSYKSASFLQLQNLSSKPLVASMGLLSRLIAHAIGNCSLPIKVVEARCNLLTFSENIFERWQRMKFSQIHPSEESKFVTQETQRITIPLLWRVLKTAMFTMVIILRAIMARTLIDPLLSSEQHAPITASQALLILKNIHFISSRHGSDVLSAYTFVKLSSIDILTLYPYSAVAFLRSIYPPSAGTIPSHHLERNQDLFYLNTAEHFALCLGPANAESLILQVCTPYLSVKNNQLFEIFEAAHSAILSVFAAPQNTELTVKFMPLYVEKLFESFPSNLSPRQFRFAFKTLVQICSPPSLIHTSQPMMTETLLEVLHQRALDASTVPVSTTLANKNDMETQGLEITLSEQTILLLALLDALPNVTLRTLEIWLPLATDLLRVIPDDAMRKHCQSRFWEVLVSGEMDVERSAICVAWWTTKGGREMVLYGGKGKEYPKNTRDQSRL